MQLVLCTVNVRILRFFPGLGPLETFSSFSGLTPGSSAHEIAGSILCWDRRNSEGTKERWLVCGSLVETDFNAQPGEKYRC